MYSRHMQQKTMALRHSNPITILSLQLTHELSQTVSAGNDKAALFGVLAAIVQLDKCVYLFWGIGLHCPRQIIILIGWQPDVYSTGRPTLPLDRIRPFIYERPAPRTSVRVWDADFGRSLKFTAEVEYEIEIWAAAARRGFSWGGGVIAGGPFGGCAVVSKELGTEMGTSWLGQWTGSDVLLVEVRKRRAEISRFGWRVWCGRAGAEGGNGRTSSPSEKFEVMLSKFQVSQRTLQAWRKSVEMGEAKEQEGLTAIVTFGVDDDGDDDGWCLVKDDAY